MPLETELSRDRLNIDVFSTVSHSGPSLGYIIINHIYYDIYIYGYIITQAHPL